MAVLINTGVRAGTPVQAAALPVGRRARPDGIVATHDAATGSVASIYMYRSIGGIGIQNTRSHVPIRYDTMRDAIITCARKPT